MLTKETYLAFKRQLSFEKPRQITLLFIFADIMIAVCAIQFHHVDTFAAYVYSQVLLTLFYFPNLPWYRLKKLRHIIKPMLSTEYNEVIGINWNLNNRSRDLPDVMLPELSHPSL